MPNFRNPSYQDLIQGFNDRMAALGQPFELLRTGETFQAIAINVHPIDPRLEQLGSDIREHCTIEARRDQIPRGMAYGDVVRQANPPWNTTEFQQFPIWKLVLRDDNSANFAIKFWAVKVSEEEKAQVYAQLGVSPPIESAV